MTTRALSLCAAIWVAADVFQRTDPVRRVYPVIGWAPKALRRVAEIARVETTTDGPFSASEITDIRTRGLHGTSIASFGSRRHPLSATPQQYLQVAVLPSESVVIENVTLGNSCRRTAIDTSLVNFGALGFGPVNRSVIESLAIAASQIGCLQSTGEDGLTPFHQRHGAKLIWQVGPGYWGCRESDGTFSPEAFQDKAANPAVAAVELKLSQGARPGGGGMMPARKNTDAVASVLGVEPGVDIVSPARHSAFDDVPGMLRFLGELKQLSGGKPTGVKLCIGSRGSISDIVRGAERTGALPDFITVDGGEGGSGASRTVLQEHAGLPVRQALPLMNSMLASAGMRRNITLFAAGALKDGYDVVEMLALGADACFMVRAPLVAIGCVQARTCHSGDCPAGIATHNRWRERAIIPRVQGQALVRFHQSVLDDIAALLKAAGLASTREIGPDILQSDFREAVDG